ncbi:MAG TPA: putative porin [Candidatus Sulfomarinibacteraceae bacterium]|nr:putative porin [Candidatus Sulfomarinibacteraceae bacterium]
MKLWLIMTLAFAVSTTAALAVATEEPDLDPLLQLLVEQGVITEEQARGVQAEYDRRASEVDRASAGDGSERAEPTAPPAPPPADPTAAAPEKGKWHDRIELKGDLRLRYEGFWVDGISDNDHRSRFRLRVRPGIYSDVTEWMRVGFQLRSGDPDDPVSDNQSVDGGFSMKAVAISEAFAAFTPTPWLGVHAGKFDPKRLWTVSDMQWDDDVTVEGLLEELDLGNVEASLYQYFLEERSGGGDSVLYGGQVRGVVDLGSRHQVTVGAGYDEWVNPQYVADLTLSGNLKGNRVTNILDDDLQLVSDFQIGSLFAEWSFELSERWPVKLSAFGYHNFGAGELGGRSYDDAYFVRFQVGDYSKPGRIALRASRYYSQPDALFYVFTQSDTTMASDVDGYRFDLRLGFVMKSYFNVTWYHTDPASDLVDVATMDRLQVDYIIRF